MSYGKYGMKNIGAGMPNNMMGIAYNDPWFAAGALLAQNLNKNYEDRGNKKAIDAALAELSPTGNAQEQQLATQQFQGMQPQDGTLQGRNMLGIGAGYTVPTGKGLLGGEIPANSVPATGTGLFGSMTPPEPEKDLIERVKEDAYAKGGPLSNAVLTHKLLEAGANNPNAPLTDRQLLGLTPPTTDTVPSAKEMLGLQDTPKGPGLFGGVFPEKKEEPKGGLLTNAMINYYLSDYGPTPKPKAPESAVPEGKGLFGSVFPHLYQKEEPKGGLLTTAIAKYARSPLENTSNQMLRDYLGDYSLGKDAQGNTVLNKSQGIGDIAQGMANQRLQNFDAGQWMANKQLELMRQGYTPEQIGYIMEPLAQKAMGIQQEQYKAKMGDVVNRYFDLAAKGDYNGAAKLAFEALRYDPQAANTLLGGTPTPKNIWDVNTQQANALERMGKQYELGQRGADANVGRQITLNDHSYGNQVKLAELQRAWKVADDKQKIQMMLQYPEVFGRGKNSVATQQKAFLAAADKEIEAFQKWQELNYGKTPGEYPHYSRYQQAQAYKDQYWGVGQFDENDYYAWKSFIDEAKRAGYSDAQIAEAVRAKGGDMTDAILSGYNLVVPQAAPQQAPQPAPQAPKPQVDWSSMVPDEDWRSGSNRGEGLTGAFRGLKDITDGNIKYMDEVSKRKKY